jgi:mannan polymerase II complex MNN11 subunit
VVLVTLMDETGYTPQYWSRIKENRKKYADRHGYAVYTANPWDFNLGGAPAGWGRIPAVRKAMAAYPDSTYFFYLDSHALIMNQALSLHSHILEKSRIEKIMLRDQPVVPPDSVIKTFRHLTGDRIEFVLTQDNEGLHQGSWILRRDRTKIGMSWAEYLLDSWYDPMFRFYNFQKEEQHALEHIVQWHPTILLKLALVPQRIMNSYNRAPQSPKGLQQNGLYEEGDFVVHFWGCDKDKTRDCEAELDPFWDFLQK